MTAGTPNDQQLLAILQDYLRALQEHPSAEEMMKRVVTADFETGFIGGQVWRGLDGLREFLSQREGFFDEEHVIEELLQRCDEGDAIDAHTRLRFFLRRWEAPSPHSEEFTGRCLHTWRIHAVDGEWRVAAQMVERFQDLNENAQRLFATPESGLNR
jgi:SnoaL-like protein